MPRARDPAREKAREIWLSSGKTAKLCDIAKQLSVPDTTIRAWKSKDGWDKKSERNAPNNDRNAPKRKRGGQPGNTNATGGPPGNKKALATGEFETIFFKDLLDEEERSLLAAEYSDKRIMLQHQISTLVIRERRMLKRIGELRNGKPMITRTTYTSSEPTDQRKADGTEAMSLTSVKTEQEAHDDRIIRFEDALTRVQAELRRCIDSMRQVEEAEAELVGKNGTGTLADAIMNAYHMRKGGDDDA